MAGTPINTGTLPRLLQYGVRATFGQVYAEHPEEWRNLYDVMTSDMNYEEMVQVVDFGLAPVKPEGQNVTFDSEIQGYTARWVHVPYGLGYIVTHEQLMDNLYPQVTISRAKSLAMAMRQTKENVAASIFNNAFSSSYPGPDGVPFISTAHPFTSGGGTFSNRLAIDANLSESALEDIVTQIMQTTNDRGYQISLMPVSLHVAPNNYFTASRILKSLYQTATANNDPNIIVANNIFPKGAFVNHYFTNPSAWFVRTMLPKGGLTFFEREPMRITVDNDFNSENLLVKAYERYSFNYADPRTCFGTSGA